MRQHRIIFVFMLIMILGVTLLTGCGTLGAGSAGGDDSGEGGTGDGGAGAGSSNEDESSGDEQDGALDEIDLSMGCPEDPYVFGVYLDYQLNAEEDDGFIYERTDPSVGVPVEIQGSQVTDLEPVDTPGVTIPVTIEGASGDCTITGMAEISLQIGGTCRSGVATLDIQGTYEIYQRVINCPGEAPIESVDSLFPGPSVTTDFHLSNSGDTFDSSQDMGEVEFIYKWTLKPMMQIFD